MRKRIIGLVVVVVFTLSGCQEASDRFLAFEDSSILTNVSIDNRLTQNGFFAEDLAIVTEDLNVGEDQSLLSGATILVNATDNEILYADNVYDKLYPASLTKLMTALVVLKYGELTDSVSVSYNATHITESGARVCGFEEGDIITLEALLNSLLIYSGNDAAIAIADHISGSEEAYVEKMNIEAKKLGAVHTNFVNSNGLHDDNQYTSAYDIYLIFNELMKYDTFRSIINTTSFTAIYTDKDGNEKEKTFDASNLYLGGDAVAPEGMNVLGGKTGTTSKAGNCLVLLSNDGVNTEYISVILKATNSEALYSQMTYLLSLTK